MPKLKEIKQKEAKERDEAYAKLTLDQKIERQIKGGHNGKQLARLLKLKEKTALPVQAPEKKDAE